MDNLPKPAIEKPEELVAAYTLAREQFLALDVSESAINRLPEPKFKVRPEQEEPKKSGVTMNDLPELPFEKILGYLSLQERIKCRAVSRRWCKTIDSFRPKSLCYSEQPSGFIYGKNRWVSGGFAWNFVNSTRFDSFFRTFGQSIFSNLKYLRLCDIFLGAEHATALFDQTLNSFGQLEELDIIRFGYGDCNPKLKSELNLPMLNSIQLEEAYEIDRLTLDAPKLQNVKIWKCSFSLDLDIVRVESVEKLVIWDLGNAKVKNLKNLKYLQIAFAYEMDSTFISGLEQLKEVHLVTPAKASEMFEQKERYGRVDLKIFLRGCLLSGPNDPAMDSLSFIFDKETIAYLAKHPARLADQIPFRQFLDYSAIEGIPRGSETSILNRFTNLHQITVSSPVQDIERFLDILKSLDNIADLRFECDQAQDLFDRLPDCCAVQKLRIRSQPADFGFVCRFSHLIELDLDFEIDVKIIREILEELKFLSWSPFEYLNNQVTLRVKHHPKRFMVRWKNNWTEMSDLDSLIRFFVQIANE